MRVAHNDVKAPLTLVQLPNFSATKCGFDQVVDVRDIDAIAGNRLPVNFNGQGLLPRQALHTQVNGAGHGAGDASDLFRDALEFGQIVTKHLDGQLRTHTGHHFVHPLCDGLVHDHLHTRQDGQRFANVIFNLGLGAAGFTVNHHNRIGFVGADRVGQRLTPAQFGHHRFDAWHLRDDFHRLKFHLKRLVQSNTGHTNQLRNDVALFHGGDEAFAEQREQGQRADQQHHGNRDRLLFSAQGQMQNRQVMALQKGDRLGVVVAAATQHVAAQHRR